MAEVIRGYDGQYLNHEEIEMVADIISKHMGQWNKDKKSDIELQKPNNKYARMVHLADYLASRKVLTMDFSDYATPKVELPDINEYVLSFGKHKGKTLIEINKIDAGWISWAKENIHRHPEAALLKQL